MEIRQATVTFDMQKLLNVRATCGIAGRQAGLPNPRRFLHNPTKAAKEWQIGMRGMLFFPSFELCRERP
jgi:hypothetical protein